jgi:hypothetical protein
MAEVVSRLEIEAEHVVFGHTHRAGPSKGEPPWRVANGVQLVNAGNWAYAPELVGDAGGGSPFWPGTCVYVDAAGPPVVRRLVEELPARLAAFSNT